MIFNSPEIKCKQKAKILCVSDSHGSQKTLERIIKKFGSLCNALCFCGDGIKDLLNIIEQSQFDTELAQNIPEYIYVVQGNGDDSTYRFGKDAEILTIPLTVDFKVCGINIMMSHGHQYDVYYGMDYLYDASIVHNANLVFFGHTHLSNVQTKYGITLLNPGSCARPRGGTPHTFTIISIEEETKKIHWNYYEMNLDKDKKINFSLYTPHLGELALLW